MARDEEVIYIEDEFEAMAEFGRRNRGAQHQATSGGIILHGWEALSNGKTIGNRVNVVYTGTQVDQIAPILEINGADKDAQQVSIMLAAPQFTTGNDPQARAFQDNVEILAAPAAFAAALPAVANPIAIIEWGIGGVQHRAELDFTNGAGMCISASFVRIRSRIFPASTPTTSCVYQLGANVSPGWPKPLAATRTMDLGGPYIAAAETAIQAIPRFARQVTFCGVDQSAFPALGAPLVGAVRFWRTPSLTAAQNLMGEYTFAAVASNEQYVPIPNGAYYYSFVAQSRIDILNAIFNLAV